MCPLKIQIGAVRPNSGGFSLVQAMTPLWMLNDDIGRLFPLHQSASAAVVALCILAGLALGGTVSALLRHARGSR